MSKNMTRKGLAFGAGLSLIASGFAGLPAQAAGISNGTVSLAPNAGSNYAVLLGDDFALKANSASSATGSGKYLKFLVEDSSAALTVDVANSSKYVVTATGTAVTNGDGTNGAPAGTNNNLVTVTFGAAHKFKQGDKVDVRGGTGNTHDGFVTVTSVPSPTTITYTAITAGAQATGTPTVTLVPSYQTAGQTAAARGVATSFVFDTKADTNTSDKVLVLTTASTTSKSATVTAWIDDNDNGKIDATEFQSPARTVQFMNINDVVPTVTLAPVSDKAADMTAYITTAPALNGDQLGQKVGAVFTRQDSALEIAVLGSWDDDTQIWTATKSLTITNTAGNVYGDAADGDWTDLPNPGDSDITEADSKIASEVATITATTAPHNLRVGDKVDISGVTEITDGLYTVTSVPSTATFTVAVPGKANATVLTGTGSYDVDTHAADTSLYDRAVPGTYTARFAAMPKADIDNGETTAQFLDKVGAAVTSGATAKTAGSLVVDAVQSATVGKTGDTTTSVFTGTKTGIGLSVLVLNEKGNPVAANVPVSATVDGAPTGAGDFTVNGQIVANGSVVFAMTNAAGVANFELGNSIAAAGDSISLNVSSQGLANVAETFTWGGYVYSIVDLNDTTTQASGIRDRAVTTNGTYTFDLLVRDQFKTPIDGTKFRIKATVTGDTVFTRYVSITNGRATLAVTDEQISSSDAFSAVQLELEELVLGTWSAAADAKVVIWDQAYSAGAVTLENDEQRIVRVGNYTGTAAIVFNANGASLPSTTAAALTATVEAKEFVEADQRVANVAAPSLTAASAAKVTGQIRNSVTAVAIKGAPFTISGAGLLFKSGEVWKKDSISAIADKDGFFEVQVYSRTSGEKTLTMTSMGVSNTVKVTYTGLTSQSGYSVVLTAPESVQSGSTYRVEGQVLDVNGNGIAITTAGTGTNPTLSVSYLGLGLVSGALPTTTDKDGKFYFFVLVGTNDKGTATITASYDADGTSTTLAAATVSKTVFVGQSAPSEAKVNAGSFKGFVAVYARGYEGKRLSAKIGNDWVIVPSLASNFERVTDFTGAGVSISVRIYIDRVLTATIPLVTK